MNVTRRKLLVFRLSSLGDVILSASALEALPEGVDIHWVTAREFAPLLEGHRRVEKVHSFDRKMGLGSWLSFCRARFDEGYDEVLDLHGSLRTRLARFFFLIWSVRSARLPHWRQVPRQKWRAYGHFIFKSWWPSGLRPEKWVRRHARIAGGTGEEKPDLSHLLKRSGNPVATMKKDSYVCVMPGSLWAGKRWPVSKFVEAIELAKVPVVVLGTAKDLESTELVARLREKGLPHESGVGAWTIEQTAAALAGARAYFGNDTGLAHLAEAVGTPSVVVFGPTVPEMGFGPWREASRAIGVDLWCRPCGKDGRHCIRAFDRYACLKRLEPRAAADQLRMES